jgi:CRISPR-associated protein Csm5
MKIFDSYRLLMTPLSPIHIGTGDSYEPTNYVIEEDLLHEFDTGAVMAAMTAADRKALLDIGRRKPNPEMLQAMQRFFFERREVLMAYGVNRIPVLPGVADICRSRVGQAANREANGNKVFNQLEIDRTAYNPITRRPVLFGSSLKGAIRTALLDGLNRGALLPKSESNNRQLQQRLFQYQSGKFELDPLRLIHLADAVWYGEPDLPAAQVYLAVNRKKAPVKDEQGHLRKSQAESKNPHQILESVPGWRYLDPEWDRSIEMLLEQARARMEHGEVFLLRVGRHSGAESVTLNGVRNIKIMQGKGQNPEYGPTAKTFWLAANGKDQKQNLLPFGWLLVEVRPLDSPPEDWLELKSACQPYLTDSRALAAKLAEKRAMLEQVRIQAEAKRREEAEQARRRAEEAACLAQAEIERQARLAAMGPEKRAIEDLRCLFADESQRNTLSPGSATIDKLNQLLAQAQGWPPKIAHGLADLAEEVYRHKAIGWGSGEKKRARRAKIEALRIRS